MKKAEAGYGEGRRKLTPQISCKLCAAQRRVRLSVRVFLGAVMVGYAAVTARRTHFALVS